MRGRISLSPSELDQLTKLAEALHAPFEFPDVDAWRHAVNHHVRLLLDAHKVVFMLPGPGHAPVYCQRLDPDGFQAYIDYYHRFDVAGSIALEQSMPVASLLELHGRDEFYSSEYYNDFMNVWDCNHSVGLVTPMEGEPGYAYLGVLRDKYQDEPFDARTRALMRFLLPALRAGIRTYLRLARDRAILGTVLDASGSRRARAGRPIATRSQMASRGRRSPGRRPVIGSRSSLPACSPSAWSPSNGSGSPRALAWSGSSPTSR